ncbi:MAG: Uncharacterised protein [Flavobacteriia bacterium]|nr:MAG: Uncharacterised protein [Flavobacteriia bacterium]
MAVSDERARSFLSDRLGHWALFICGAQHGKKAATEVPLSGSGTHHGSCPDRGDPALDGAGARSGSSMDWAVQGSAGPEFQAWSHGEYRLCALGRLLPSRRAESISGPLIFGDRGPRTGASLVREFCNGNGCPCPLVPRRLCQLLAMGGKASIRIGMAIQTCTRSCRAKNFLLSGKAGWFFHRRKNGRFDRLLRQGRLGALHADRCLGPRKGF